MNNTLVKAAERALNQAKDEARHLKRLLKNAKKLAKRARKDLRKLLEEQEPASARVTVVKDAKKKATTRSAKPQSSETRSSADKPSKSKSLKAKPHNNSKIEAPRPKKPIGSRIASSPESRRPIRVKRKKKTPLNAEVLPPKDESTVLEPTTDSAAETAAVAIDNE